MNTQDVTRFEVIDERGRRYVRHGVVVDLQVQDNGRTLKAFVEPCNTAVKQPPGVYVIDPTNPPRTWWPLGNIFRGIRQEWRLISVATFVDEFAERRKTDLYGYILMACVSEQVAFLAAFYDSHYPDDDVQMALRSLVKNGRMVDMLDRRQGEPLLHTAYNAVMEAWGKM